MVAAIRTGLFGAAVTGGFEVLVSRPSPNATIFLKSSGKHILFWTAITTTFTTTVLFLTNVRKKDDPLNYFLGAIASCAVMYSITKQGPLSFGLATSCGIGAAMLKSGFLNGYDPFDMSMIRHDWHRMSMNFENSPDVRYVEQK
ncbi:hypothetical protein KPH14_010425 [Odynerus spinipes]|uniref:NADH dehydrogenase [ubiquinone] 1 alpha subcomplex subunit 11 n=1 Tax=Odynerus spinipes TaxID=1348599 RepID=A0AAD9VTT7_9HYME|nr:hypothetical protein KPH14_010425 [Odynerus spinipes]